MKNLILLILILLTSLTSFASEVYYDDIGLKKLSPYLIQDFEKTMTRHEFSRVFIPNRGSQILGLNLMFTDDFSTSVVALKYDVSGSFELNKVYHYGGYSVIHTQVENKKVAILSKNVNLAIIKDIASSLSNLKTKTTFTNPFISEVHADECGVSSPLQNFDTGVAEHSFANKMGKCFSKMGDGAYESTIGTVKGAYRAVSNEFSALLKSPKQRLSDYYSFVTSGVDELMSFSKILGQMMVNPAYASSLLASKYGEFGNFISSSYKQIRDLPMQTKIDILCNIVGALGIDAVIAMVTAGAASGKVMLSMAKIMAKMKKVVDLISRAGKAVSTYVFNLSDALLVKLEKVIDNGLMPLMDSKLKVAGCAIK